MQHSATDLATERAARAIWRALHPANEVRPWDAFEHQAYLDAARAAAQVFQADQVTMIPHRGRVS